VCSAWFGENPRLAHTLILELRLVLCIFQGLMPRICDLLPVGITSKEVESVLAGKLADRQSGHRPHQLAANDLLACACESVAIINWRVANHTTAADAVRARLHVITRFSMSPNDQHEAPNGRLVQSKR